MANNSAIEWTETTWNPLGGCTPISPGCLNCYAATMAHRLEAMGQEKYRGLTVLNNGRRVFNGKLSFDEKALEEPLRWKRPRMVFVNSMSDLFHEDVPTEFIDRVWDVMWKCPQHTFQILTKRPERMVEYVRTRASVRDFDWTDRGRTPMRPGTVMHLETLYDRDRCGYVGEGRYQCDHPENGSCGEEFSCHSYSCPIAYEVTDREGLEKIGVADEYKFDEEGYTDETEWMELHGRPRFAAAGNVWLGFSAENQKTLEERARIFRSLRWFLGPHFVLFASLEPLLGPISFRMKYHAENEDIGAGWSPLDKHDFGDGNGPLDRTYLDWVIVGGESGPGARPCGLEWIRGVVSQCKAAGVPVFVKQMGCAPLAQEGIDIETKEEGDRSTVTYHHVRPNPAAEEDYARRYELRFQDKKGGNPAEWPEDLRVREFPRVEVAHG